MIFCEEWILHQLRLAVYPIIYKVLYIPGGCLGLGMERSWKIQRKELKNWLTHMSSNFCEDQQRQFWLRRLWNKPLRVGRSHKSNVAGKEFTHPCICWTNKSLACIIFSYIVLLHSDSLQSHPATWRWSIKVQDPAPVVIVKAARSTGFSSRILSSLVRKSGNFWKQNKQNKKKQTNKSHLKKKQRLSVVLREYTFLSFQPASNPEHWPIGLLVMATRICNLKIELIFCSTGYIDFWPLPYHKVISSNCNSSYDSSN